MREVSLGIAFEGARLFAFGTINGFGSRAEAEAVLKAGVNLAIEAGGAFIRSEGRILHHLSEIEGDEFGRWLDDADRESEEDYLASRLPQGRFLAELQADGDLRPVSWVMGEYEVDDEGNLLAIVGSTSGTIDTPASDQRSSSEDQQMADHLL